MTILVDGEQNVVIDEIEIFYLSPAASNGTRIEAFTGTNTSGSNKTYKAYIFNANGTLKEAIIPLKILVLDRFDLGPSIINHEIPPGGTLRMESTLEVTFWVAGKVL